MSVTVGKFEAKGRENMVFALYLSHRIICSLLWNFKLSSFKRTFAGEGAWISCMHLKWREGRRAYSMVSTLCDSQHLGSLDVRTEPHQGSSGHYEKAEVTGWGLLSLPPPLQPAVFSFIHFIFAGNVALQPEQKGLSLWKSKCTRHSANRGAIRSRIAIYESPEHLLVWKILSPHSLLEVNLRRDQQIDHYQVTILQEIRNSGKLGDS